MRRRATTALLSALIGFSAACAKDSEVTRPSPPRTSVLAHPRPPARPDDDATTPDPAPRRSADLARALPLPNTPRHHLFLGKPHQGSLSMGGVTEGWLYAGAELPLTGAHHRVTTTQSLRGTNHGTQELVGALLHAADAVAARYPEAVLQVGNMAKGGGGDLPWSVSHNNGRDVDIAFYLLAPDGSQPPLDDLVRLDASGKPADSLARLRFDAGRNWELVKALLTDETIELQYIFVANPLKGMLLDLAKAHREPKSLIARAEAVLRQPMGALPHDDHFHVRIYCPESNVAEGCVDTGRVRPGVTLHPERATTRIPSLIVALKSKSAKRRAAATYLLGVLGAREATAAIGKRLGDKSADVRMEALDALERLRAMDQIERIQRRAAREPDGRIARRALQVLGAFALGGAERARSALIELVSDTRELTAPRGLSEERFTVRARAAKLLGRLAVRRAVPTLIAALPDADPQTSAALQASLALLTNRSTADLAAEHAAGSNPPPAPSAAGSISAPPQLSAAEAASLWGAWWAANKDRSPLDWLVDGFKATGHSMEALDARAATSLLGAVIDTRDHVSFNAQRGLMSIAKTDPGSLAWSRQDAYAHWSRWAIRNARKLRAECQRLEKAAKRGAGKKRGGKKGGKSGRGRSR